MRVWRRWSFGEAVGFAELSQPIVSTGAVMLRRISWVRVYTRSQLEGGAIASSPDSSLTFFAGWRREAFFLGMTAGWVSVMAVSSLFGVMVVVGVSAPRLRFSVGIELYSSLNVEGASERSESVSSCSFLISSWAVVRAVGAVEAVEADWRALLLK